MTRNELRKLIVSHPQWDSVRQAENFRSDALSAADLRYLGTRFHILGTNETTSEDDTDSAIADTIAAGQALLGQSAIPRSSHITVALRQSPPPLPAMKSDAELMLEIIKRNSGQQTLDLDQINTLINEAIVKALSKHDKTIIHNVIVTQGETTTQVNGACHPNLAKLIKLASLRNTNGHFENIWLTGPAGSGKSYATKQLSEALASKFYVQGSMSMPHEVLGHMDGHGKYQSTPFVDAFRNGGTLVLEELDSGSNEALLTLNEPLAGSIMPLPNGEQLARHPDFRCIGCANTTGYGATPEYVGRCKLDGAFLNRFAVQIDWPYDEAFEVTISGNLIWAKRVQRARRRANEAKLKKIISPRHSIAGAMLIQGGFTQDEAASLTYLSGLTPEQANMIGG